MKAQAIHKKLRARRCTSGSLRVVPKATPSVPERTPKSQTIRDRSGWRTRPSAIPRRLPSAETSGRGNAGMRSRKRPATADLRDGSPAPGCPRCGYRFAPPVVETGCPRGRAGGQRRPLSRARQCRPTRRTSRSPRRDPLRREPRQPRSRRRRRMRSRPSGPTSATHLGLRTHERAGPARRSPLRLPTADERQASA